MPTAGSEPLDTPEPSHGAQRAAPRSIFHVVQRSAENRGTAPRRIAINCFALPGANSRSYFGAGTGVPVELYRRG